MGEILTGKQKRMNEMSGCYSELEVAAVPKM